MNPKSAPNAQRNAEHYGRGEHELTEDDLAEVSGPDFKGELSRLFSSPGYQPPALPVVALKVMELSRRTKVEFDEVVKVLEQDPMLVAKVMARIQSAAYASATPIRTLKQAVVRLGIGGLRDLVLEVALNLRVFRAQGFAQPMNVLRRHSLFTAHCSRAVCRYTSVEPEYAFLCGLLHDVGIAAVLVALGEGKVKVAPDPILLWKTIEETHEEVSALVATFWKLPEEIKLVLANHHSLTIGGYVHPMIAVLTVAHSFAEKAGGGMSGIDGLRSPIDTIEPPKLAKARAALRLGEQQLQCIERDLRQVQGALDQGL
jgi:putative nucleotidyltransferase with HDIG domain